MIQSKGAQDRNLGFQVFRQKSQKGGGEFKKGREDKIEKSRKKNAQFGEETQEKRKVDPKPLLLWSSKEKKRKLNGVLGGGDIDRSLTQGLYTHTP